MADDATRRAIRVWMREVMDSRNWSANRWATLAGTSPTNITRFLSPSCKIAPSAATLTKLIKVAGSQPNLGQQPHLRSVAPNSVPVLSWDLTTRSLVPTGQRIMAGEGTSSKAFAFICETDAMNLSGIVAGDIVTVEPTNQISPKLGRILVARYGDTLVMGEYQPPFIVPKSTNHTHKIVETTLCTLIGTVVAVTRKLV